MPGEEQERPQLEPAANLIDVIRRARFGLIDVREISQIANRDFGIRVERTEDHFPEDEWTWYHEEGEGNEPDTVYVLERDLRERNGLYNLGSLFHEVIGGHRAFSDSHSIPRQFFDNRALWFLMEAVEDPAVNRRTIQRYPLARYLIGEMYREDYDLLPETNKPGMPTSMKAMESIASFAMMPLHLQYCFNMIYRWYHSLENPAQIPNHPGVSNPQVLSLTDQTWDAFQRALVVEVSPVDGSKTAQTEALAATQKARMEIVEKEMMPGYMKLVEQSKQEYKQRRRKGPQKKDDQEREQEQKQEKQKEQEKQEQKQEEGQGQQGEGKPHEEKEKEEEATGSGEGKEDEAQKDKEAEDEINKIEEALQKKMRPKLKQISKEEAEKLKQQKQQQDQQEQQETQDLKDFLQQFQPDASEQKDKYVERTREQRLAIYNAILDLPETREQIEEFLHKADVAFREKKRGMTDKFRRPRDQRTGLEEGDLDEEIAYQATWGDTHVFSTIDKVRERREGMRNYCTTLLLDASGSMGWSDMGKVPQLDLPEGMDKKIPVKAFRALQGAIIYCEGADRLGVSREVLAFNAENHVLVPYDEPLDDEAKVNLVSYLDLITTTAAGWNNDGYALDWATQRNYERQLLMGEIGLTIHLSDGLPAPDADHEGPEYDLQHIIDTVGSEGRSELIGLGLGPGTEHVEDFYKAKDGSQTRTGRHIPDVSKFSAILTDLLFQKLFK